MEELL